MTLAVAASNARIPKYGGPATIPALMLLGGIGLAYWALFSPSGLVAKNRVPYVPSSPTGSDYPPPSKEDRNTPTGGTISLTRFMAAIARVESGGNYTARNASTGAYGKYQILPSTWKSWAHRYLGNANAPMTPHNQEIVASKQMAYYYNVLGDWRLVAAAWYAGGGVAKQSPWTWGSRTKRYVTLVSNILGLNPPNFNRPHGQ